MNLSTYLNSCTESKCDVKFLRPITPLIGCLIDDVFNILIDDNAVYLADFVEARDYSPHEMMGTASIVSCGTPMYRAPEFTLSNLRGFPADVFSLGCFLLEMLSIMCGRSLGDSQKWRGILSCEILLAFRANLAKVREWIGKLEDDSELEKSSTLIKANDPQQI